MAYFPKCLVIEKKRRRFDEDDVFFYEGNFERLSCYKYFATNTNIDICDNETCNTTYVTCSYHGCNECLQSLAAVSCNCSL